MSVDAQSLGAGDRAAVARALNVVSSDDRGHGDALLEAVVHLTRDESHVVGLTGPPGVGKSTLAGRLIAAWRSEGWTVGVLAIDPSSRRSGGALLGDRARMDADGDPGVFIRSMAAGPHLGGLAEGAFEAVAVLRAAFDRVLVETVGVGQSETEVSEVVDTTVVVLQPASGDSLQFLKAGLMEVPDLVVVNKADLGALARRTRADAIRALTLAQAQPPEVLLVSAQDDATVASLVAALGRHRVAQADVLVARRREQLGAWAIRRLLRDHGRHALEGCGGAVGARARLKAVPDDAPVSALFDALQAR